MVNLLILSGLLEGFAREASSEQAKVMIKALNNFCNMSGAKTTMIPRGTQEKINCISRRFIWSGNSEKNNMSMVSWDRIYQPKMAGRLRLKNLFQMNGVLLVKIGWNIIVSPTSLWIKVLCSKYGVENDNLPTELPRKYGSYVWCAVGTVWQRVLNGIRWQVGDGSKIRFWNDCWVMQNVILKDYVVMPVPSNMLDNSIRAYVDNNGQWNWVAFNNYLPHSLVLTIAAIMPPCVEAGIDRQQSVKTFLWLAIQNKLKTKAELARRHILAENQCARCKVFVEDSLHALRDYVAAKHIWLALVPFSLRDRFFSLDLKDWILTNLKPNRYDSNGVDWSVIFGIAIWRLWFWRNQALFNNVQRSNHNIILDIMARAENSYKTMMTLIKPGASKIVKYFGWKLPPKNAFKLNTDGACKKMNRAAAGGLMRNANGNQVAGFYAHIGISSITNVELWGLFYGTDLAWKLGVQNLLVEVDSKCTIDLLANTSNSPNRTCTGMLSHVLFLFSLEPNTELQNVTQYSDGFETSQKLVHESKSDFAKAIREQLDRIEVASSSSSKVQIAPDTPQSSKIGVLEKDDQTSIASFDLEAFTEEPVSKANKIHWELAIPTSKSPPDLTIDNRPSALNQARYNASSVYEWNIDGMSEYNILGVLQQMTMAANAYKTQSGTSDKAIAEILIAGFTGQLKGWWDHLLTKLQQLDIFNAIQIDENGAPILDEFNNPIQDAVATLILTISLHFIGDPSHLRDKNAELLHNLRCRKLSDFQEYKTTFFTRLFLRDDANHVTWKEKFLAGLPTLLGEKVRNSIKALYDNRIPYDELTYGELVSFVNKEGLNICQDLKLQKRLKQELRRSKQELGSFCKQFNYDPFKASTSKNCNGKCSSKPYKKHYKSKSHRKPFHDFRKLPYKKPSRPYKKHSFSKKKEFKAKPKTPFNFKDATCFKCGMKGHTAKFCRMNKRLQELDLNEDILSKIAPLLIESSDSESSMSGDSNPLQVDELFDSDTSASSSSDSDSDSYLKKINVLTKDQEIFLELVKHISDPNLQKDYLDKLLKTMDSDKAGTSVEISKVPIIKKNSYDLTQILDKKKTKKMVPNIQDLQKEIKEIKCEIRDLKEKQKSDSETIQLLLQKQLQDNSDNESNPDDGDEIKVENIESVPNDFLFVLKQITTRKYLIKVTLIFSDDFAMDAIALFDTGADLNCIREEIVPKRFHEKTKERLSAANNSKLNETTFGRFAL
ncbi:putative ribonuclease H protein [Citrus sinensis]|nr:putative ribonuclease H protein [Citrus sinensis]